MFFFRGEVQTIVEEFTIISENFTTLGFDDFSHRFNPFGQITYAPNTVLPVVFLAPTQRQFDAISVSEGSDIEMVETTGKHFSERILTREAAI